MTTHRFLLGILLCSSVMLGTSVFGAQRNPSSSGSAASPTGTPVRTIITVRQRHGHGDGTPDVTQRDVQVREGRDLRPVTEWVPAQGQQAGLELLLLLDDSSRFVLGGQLDVLRKFITDQPTTTMIGVGYMHNGMAEMTQPFTSDHAAIAQSLRMPEGSAAGAASPYLSITDVLMHWPVRAEYPRREILMMSDGIDPYGGGGALNTYVNEAIDAVQRAGVTVYSIYTPGADRNGQRVNLANWGKTYLSMISEQSGGDAFYLGFGSAVSFAPYLDNLMRDLNHQYLLTFLAQPQEKGGFQKVKVSTEIPNAQLVAPDKVFVPIPPR